MKKYKFEELKELEKELIDNLLDGSKINNNLDTLINAYEKNIKDKDRLKSVKYKYLLALAMEDDFICSCMFNLISPEILEYFVPKMSILTRIREVIGDE